MGSKRRKTPHDDERRNVHHLMKIMDDRVGRLLQDGRDYTKRFWHWHLSRSLNPDQHQTKK